MTVARRVYAKAEARVVDCRLVSAAGTVRAVRCRLAPVTGEHGEVHGLIGTVADHTDVERQLEHRATHDELTELPNRVLLAAHLDAALGRARRAPQRGRRALRRAPAGRGRHRCPRPRHR